LYLKGKRKREGSGTKHWFFIRKIEEQKQLVVFASFRYATCAETLEHLFNILEITLREINLEKGGKKNN